MFARSSQIDGLKQEAWRAHKLINGYIRFLRTRTNEGGRTREDDGNTGRLVPLLKNEYA